MIRRLLIASTNIRAKQNYLTNILQRPLGINSNVSICPLANVKWYSDSKNSDTNDERNRKVIRAEVSNFYWVAYRRIAHLTTFLLHLVNVLGREWR